ncbi:AI-2E family transporter [Planktosalinus lacus]|uniref:AI-2E family transporter n=1 Tax=Planktosalinus lacus TaxID=1526573 RepID=A0A8J2YCH0_9FLAO|nr:AI-2E family transporter [Planktosalinus lacus]GGE01113.1 AI-2E family transporter [Planktosalinus lacus]
MQRIHQDIIRQIFTLFLIIALGAIIFLELAPFMSGLLGAITIYIISKKPMRKLVLRGWYPSVAAAFIMIISFVGILVPIGLVVIMLSTKVKNALNKLETFISIIKDNLSIVEDQLNIQLFSSFDSQEVANWVSNNFQSVLGNTFNLFIALSILYFLLYYMLVNRKQFIESIYTYFPMRPENISTIGKEVDSVVKSNAIGIPLIAIIQGLVALLGFFIFGVPNPWFWFVITAIGSMIPFVGTAIGIVPVVILLFSTGQYAQAIGILLYGLIVVGTTDNLFRMIVQKKLADIHPLITLIGVIIGVPLFGFIGLIFGPLLISLFLVVLKIYKDEYVITKDYKK